MGCDPSGDTTQTSYQKSNMFQSLMKAMRVPSGDHAASVRYPRRGKNLTGDVPSSTAVTLHRCQSPSAKQAKAIHPPSGDQVGAAFKASFGPRLARRIRF